MKKSKVVRLAGAGLLTAGILSACGSASPTDTVNNFTSAYKKDDLKTAFNYIDGSVSKVTKQSGMNLKDSDKVMREVLKAESTGFKVNSVKELSTKGDTVKVKVDFTGKDFGSASTKAVGQVMPTAFATAFSSKDSKASQQVIQDMMFKDIVSNLNAKDAPTVNKKVTLTLKKNKDGKFLLKPDNNLEEIFLPNYDQLEKLFGGSNSTTSGSKPDSWVQGQIDDANGKSASDSQQTTAVIKNIASGKAVDANPIKVTLDEVSIKQAKNVPQDEMDRVNSVSGKNLTGNSFYYVHVKYTAENTSDQDISFAGIPQVVVFSGQTQEAIDDSGIDDKNFIDTNEDKDGEYYGKVVKHGEVGFVIDTDPSKITKLRIKVGHSMNDKTYDLGTDDQPIEFPVQ